MPAAARVESFARFVLAAGLTGASMYVGHLLRHFGSLDTQTIVASVWPATGVNIALLLMFGLRYWPAVLVGSVACNLLLFQDWRIMAAGTPADVAEAVVAVWLMRALTQNLSRAMATRRAVLSLMAAGCIGPASGILLAAVLFRVFGVDTGFPNAAWRPWVNWAIADALAAITIVPVVVTWREHLPVPWTHRPVLQGVLLAMGLAMTASVVFFAPVTSGWLRAEPLVFVTLPFIVWAALAFGAYGSARAMLLLTVIGVIGTMRRLGPFAGLGPDESVLMLQIYLGVTAAMSLLLGASTCARADTHRALSRSHAHVQILLDELDHRVRNNLASLMGLISATQQSAADVPRYAKALHSRVRAMAKTHDLTRGSERGRVAIRDVLLSVIPEDAHPRLDLVGDATTVNAKLAASLGMIINEFVSNSQMHGVLARDLGTIRLSWKPSPWPPHHPAKLPHASGHSNGHTNGHAHGHSNGNAHSNAHHTPSTAGIHFQWTELGPDTIVPTHLPSPLREGVGLRLVRGIVESELGGRADLGATSDGALHTIVFPIPRDTVGDDPSVIDAAAAPHRTHDIVVRPQPRTGSHHSTR